jgi:predicted DNA-binding transcriptional regulator AlpA
MHGHGPLFLASVSGIRNGAVMSLQDNLGRSLTIKEFCELENMSPSTFYKARRNGHTPAELRIPGSEFVRITPAAILAWRERMTKLGATKQAELERQRRVAQRRAAGVTRKRRNPNGGTSSRKRRNPNEVLPNEDH